MNKIEEQGCLLKPIVLYSSRSGNTEKIAREIASELNCRCEKIDETFDSTIIDLDNFGLVFLGTGIYSAKPNAELLKAAFIENKHPRFKKEFSAGRHQPFGKSSEYIKSIEIADLPKLAKLIKLVGMLLQTKTYLFWKRPKTKLTLTQISLNQATNMELPKAVVV